MKLIIVAFLFSYSTCGISQEWPERRPIRLIVPYGVGGVYDVLARRFAQRLSEKIGQRILIENNFSNYGVVATEMVLNSPPDGYVLLFGDAQNIINNSLLGRGRQFDPTRDLVSIGMIGRIPFVLAGAANGKYISSSSRVLLDVSAANSLLFADVGKGTQNHYGALMITNALKLKLEQDTFRSTARLIDSLASRADMLSVVPLSTLERLAREKAVHIYATMDRHKLSAFPDVPFIGDYINDVESEYWIGIFAPEGVPPRIVAQMGEGIREVLMDTRYIAEIEALGIVPHYRPSGEFRVLLRQDYDRRKSIFSK